MNTAHLPHYTYEDYLHWEGRWEVIDGIPFYNKPDVQHQLVATAVGAEFTGAVRKQRTTCKGYWPIDYLLAEDTIFNPDFLIVCGSIFKDYLDFKPELIAEVLSDESRTKDRNVKFAKYEAAGVPYYVMVEPENKSVEVYLLHDRRYHRQPLDQSEPFEFVLADCRFEMVFDSIWE